MFYINQITAAKRVVACFEEVNDVLLFAQMQSGKSGTYIYVLCEMLRKGVVENMLVFCSVTSNELVLQTEHNLNSLTSIYETENDCVIRDKITILKTHKLKDYIIPDHTLIVWDESHHAQRKDNMVGKFLMKNGVVLCDDIRKTTKILTVSATPFQELKSMDDYATEHKQIVCAEPGDGYRGVHYYLKNELVESSIPLCDDEELSEFKELLEKHKDDDTGHYGILRVSKKDDISDITLLAKHCGYNVLHHYGKFQMYEGWDILKTKPHCPTLIIIKGSARVGQYFHKEFISFVYESQSGSYRGSESMLQSLLGRVCGYGPFFHGTGTHIYTTQIVNKQSIIHETIESYLETFQEKEYTGDYRVIKDKYTSTVWKA